MIDSILPSEVAVSETFTDDTPGTWLFPEEEAFIAGAVTRRRREFATARRCGREALGKLGWAPAAIPSGPRGMPLWPAGSVGSITHCPGYRAAAVARDRDLAALGIDAEPNSPLPAGVLAYIATGDERARLEGLSMQRPGVCWDRLLFSAKEAVYKAWFPLARRWLDFGQASVSLDSEADGFTVAVLRAGGAADVVPAEFTGRWLLSGSLILTAVAVPSQGRPPGRGRAGVPSPPPSQPMP